MIVRVLGEGDPVPPSSRYDFIGTQLYAPRTSHRGHVQTRRDDLESWIYSCVDLFAPNKLPWGREHDRYKVIDMKEAFFKTPPPEIISLMPGQFEEIMRRVNAMTMMQKPDYKAIRDLLEQAAKEDDIDFDMPFEWELGEQAKRKDESRDASREQLEKTQISVLEKIDADKADKEVTERVLAG
uniref:Protein kinase domain-containing protein n=1 Tax=Steinernema glaseri TaxID=37863 RepID=A0A1I7Z3P7_9BILA